MRVLLVSEFYLPVGGGREVQVDLLAGELAARGHEVHVACLTPDPRPGHPAVRVHPVGSLAARLPHGDAARPYHPPLPDPLVRRALTRIVADVAPDVVHAHSWMAVSLPRRLPCPLVLTVHDVAFTCPKQTLLDHRLRDCDGPALARCRHCLAASGYGAPAALGLAAGTPVGRRALRPDALICITRYVRQAVGDLGARVEAIVPGCVPDDFAAVTPTPADRPYVCFAGDPGAHKGADVLIDLWAGADPPAAELRMAVTRPVGRALPPGVSAATLSHGEVADLMAGASLVAVPSRWREPLGMVAVEAMAVGTPVVASATGGLPEVVTDGHDGVLVPPGDAGALRRAIDDLLGDDDRRAAMGRQAAVTAGAYRASAIVPRVLEVYGAARG